MPIERDGSLTFTADFVMRFLAVCSNVDEARKSLPDLTAEQFARLRDGRARVTGDSKAGLHYVELPAREPRT